MQEEKETTLKNLKFLTVKQVCELLNCSIATIYRWEKEGELPFPKIRVGKSKVGFRQSDVESFIHDRVEEASA